MKKIVFIALVLLVIQKWGDINNYINPPMNYSAAHDGKVVLYATSRCGYCKMARKLMKDNNIAYFEYDINKSQEGRAQYNKLGGRGVPLLFINGEVIRGYSPDKIIALAKKS